MARYSNGIHGPFFGLVGTVVGVNRKGTFYMRSRPVKRTIPPTVRESANRQKFADAQFWLQPLKAFVREGFKGYSAKSEGFVAAKSYLMKHAFEGEDEKRVINPALVKLSYGDLPLPDHIAVEHLGGERIQFTWDTKLAPAAAITDQVMMVAYYNDEDVKNNRAVFVMHGQLRKNGKDVLEWPGMKGKVHLYIAFISADRDRRSESRYLGTMEL